MKREADMMRVRAATWMAFFVLTSALAAGQEIRLEARADKRHYRVGEPIFIILRLTNHGPKAVTVPVGCCTYTVVKLSGSGIASPAPLADQVDVCGCTVSKLLLRAGRTHEDRFLLTEDRKWGKPGTYKLKIARQVGRGKAAHYLSADVNLSIR
jgi:hypothetical protein